MLFDLKNGNIRLVSVVTCAAANLVHVRTVLLKLVFVMEILTYRLQCQF